MPIPFLTAIIVAALVSSFGTYFLVQSDSEVQANFASELLVLISKNIDRILSEWERCNRNDFKAAVMKVCKNDIESLLEKHALEKKNIPWDRILSACEEIIKAMGGRDFGASIVK